MLNSTRHSFTAALPTYERLSSKLTAPKRQRHVTTGHSQTTDGIHRCARRGAGPLPLPERRVPLRMIPPRAGLLPSGTAPPPLFCVATDSKPKIFIFLLVIDLDVFFKVTTRRFAIMSMRWAAAALLRAPAVKQSLRAAVSGGHGAAQWLSHPAPAGFQPGAGLLRQCRWAGGKRSGSGSRARTVRAARSDVVARKGKGGVLLEPADASPGARAGSTVGRREGRGRTAASEGPSRQRKAKGGGQRSPSDGTDWRPRPR